MYGSGNDKTIGDTEDEGNCCEARETLGDDFPVQHGLLLPLAGPTLDFSGGGLRRPDRSRAPSRIAEALKRSASEVPGPQPGGTVRLACPFGANPCLAVVPSGALA